ncbi:hypothetical protein VTN96DRAFT_5045 [Rasamsonia emersonii]
MAGEKSGLTESILALHNRNFVNDPNAPNSWAQKVVTEEKIHLYYSHLGQRRINRGDHTVNGIECLTLAPQGQPERPLDDMEPQSQDTTDADLKIFQQLTTLHITLDPL